MAAKRSKWTHAAAVVAAAALMSAGLSGCGIGRALGMSKSSPDEFAVVTKAPLVLPPDYELRPPKPGAKRPQEQDPSEAAKQALFKNQFGEPASAPAGSETPTTGEQALLASVGANQAGSNLSKGVEKNNKILMRKSASFSNKLMFGREDAIPAAAVREEPAPAAAPENTDEPAEEGEEPSGDESTDEPAASEETESEATGETEAESAEETEAESAEETEAEAPEEAEAEATEGAATEGAEEAEADTAEEAETEGAAESAEEGADENTEEPADEGGEDSGNEGE